MPRLQRKQMPPSEQQHEIATAGHVGPALDAGLCRRAKLSGGGLSGRHAAGDRSSDPQQILPADRCGLKVIDSALDELAQASPEIKRRVLEGCAICITADNRMNVPEGELLRVIADALECPMPPLILMPTDPPASQVAGTC